MLDKYINLNIINIWNWKIDWGKDWMSTLGRDWDWEKKKKEVKAHIKKYLIYYIFFTIMALLLAIISICTIECETNMQMGGADNNASPSNKSGTVSTHKLVLGDISSSTETNTTPATVDKDTAVNKGDPALNKVDTDVKVDSDATDTSKKIDPALRNLQSQRGKMGKKEKKGKKPKKGKRGMGVGRMVGQVMNGVSGGVANGLKNVAKFFMILMLIGLAFIAPAIIYIVIVYLMFKILLKRTIKI